MGLSNISDHSTGYVSDLTVMTGTGLTWIFFPRRPKTTLKILESTWFMEFIKAQRVTGIIQILRPKRCQKDSTNLGRSFHCSVANTKVEIYPQNYCCEQCGAPGRLARQECPEGFWDPLVKNKRNHTFYCVSGISITHRRNFKAEREPSGDIWLSLWKFSIQLFAGWRG